MGKQLFHSFVSSRIKIPEEDLSAIENDNGGIIKIDGTSVGIYKNKDGEIFAVNPTCTHLGCLTWNKKKARNLLKNLLLCLIYIIFCALEGSKC